MDSGPKARNQTDTSKSIENIGLLFDWLVTEGFVKYSCVIQHLKYVTHSVRSANSIIQKQVLFCEANGKRWKRIASYVGVDDSITSSRAK